MAEAHTILNDIKKLLNIDAEDTAFDTDIVLLINGEFNTLHQLGVGPIGGYLLNSADDTWDSFTDDPLLQGIVKTYIYMKVRMIFDPPASSVVADAFNSRIAELEFRLNHRAEYDKMEEDHAMGNQNETGGE